MIAELQHRINTLELELVYARSELQSIMRQLADAIKAAKHEAIVHAEVKAQRDIYNDWNMQARKRIIELENKVQELERELEAPPEERP